MSKSDALDRLAGLTRHLLLPVRHQTRLACDECVDLGDDDWFTYDMQMVNCPACLAAVRWARENS